MLFTMDKGLMRKGIDNCKAILQDTDKVKTDFELTELRMLGMVDKSRRMRRVYLESQDVMSSVRDTTVPLEVIVQRAQSLYNTVGATDEYVYSVIDCMQIPEITINKADRVVEQETETEGTVENNEA